MFQTPENTYETLLNYALVFKNAFITLITACLVQSCWRLLINDQLCTALVAASGDSGAEADFHESSGRIWVFCKRNATSRNAIIHYRNTKRKTNWNDYYHNTKSNWKSR